MTSLTQVRKQASLHLPALLNLEALEQLFVALTLLGIIAGSMLERAGAAPATLLLVHLATYVVGGSFALKAVIESLREGEVEVDLLMLLAAFGAAYVNAWNEGATLLFLFSLSNVLQHYAMRRTQSAISALLELRPDSVAVRREGRVFTLALEAVTSGDVIVLRPGDRVALDARISAGRSKFDESSITGESLPVAKGPGDAIFAGTLNQNGAIDAVVLRPAAESTLARIIGMVSEARERKATTQSVLDRFEQRYALGVMLAVALYILLVPLLSGQLFAQSFYTAMVLLTVASPCALVISVPAALLSAIANAARNGVLFKGGAHLEDLSRVKVVAFDKTGTLTHGRPELSDVVPAPGVSRQELLSAAARAELVSEHPLALAVVAAARAEGLALAEPEHFEAVVGLGVRASWDGMETLVGSPRLMQQQGLALPKEVQAHFDAFSQAGRGSVVLVHQAGRWLGLLAVADALRPEVAQKIAALRQAGVEHVVMLTGDSRRVAEALAREAGIDEVHAELLPADKLRIIEQLQERYGATAMVGDGINDAPALAAASVGVAMGAAGTDVALESADVVLMSDDIGKLAYALKLSQRARRVVWQNMAFALAVVVLLVASTLSIGIPLPIGVVGHEGSTLLVVLNGLRLLAYRR